MAEKAENRKDSWYADSKKENSLFDDVTEFIGKNKGKLGDAAAAIAAAPVALGAVGFGAGGVAAGGIAAADQGAVYGGATGGVFGGTDKIQGIFFPHFFIERFQAGDTV